MTLAPIVDSGSIYTQGSHIDLQPQLRVDGATIDLTGRTVQVTFRRESAFGTSLGAAWDAEACTLGNPLYATNVGGCRFQAELPAAVFTAPTSPRESTAYLAAFYVVELDYEPVQLLRFHVRKGAFA